LRAIRARGYIQIRVNTVSDIWEPTAEQFNAFVADETRRATCLGVPEFIAKYDAGELDDGDAEVARIVALLGLGQNGRH
jgi:hypothetical protein